MIIIMYIQCLHLKIIIQMDETYGKYLKYTQQHTKI